MLQYDPIGQGERIQYPDGRGGSRIGVCCPEHNYIARQQTLTGEYFGTWRVWDGMRACDYLLTRPEVDPHHLGLTGNSGGGTLTTMILANDRRFTMAAPGCYVTTWRRNAENELPADAEQQPPFTFRFGLDTDDFFGLHAPRPLILLTQAHDFFDHRGAVEVFERLKPLYRLLGAEDNVALFTGPGQHGFERPLREAMYGAFNRACGKTDETHEEPEIQVEPDEQLQVTPHGQTARLRPRPRAVFSFTRETAQRLGAERKHLSGKKLQEGLRKALNLPRRLGVPEYRILQPRGRLPEYPRPFCTDYVIETEPGTQAVVYKLEDELLACPLERVTEAFVYVPHISADEDLRCDAWIRAQAQDAACFLAVDCRGTGESRPNTCGGDFTGLYGSNYFYASYQLMFGEPYVGRRTHDVLRVLDWLEAHGCGHVHIAGRGCGSLPALFAAVLDDRITRVTLKNAPVSFAEWACSERMEWPLSSCLPYVLRLLDLPECYLAVERKQLAILEPWDARMRPLRGDRMRAILHASGTEVTSAVGDTSPLANS